MILQLVSGMVNSRVSPSSSVTNAKLSAGWSCHGYNIILMAQRKSDVCDERLGITFLRKRDQNPWQETLAPSVGLNLRPNSRVAFMPADG